jgi:hypothetical protein
MAKRKISEYTRGYNQAAEDIIVKLLWSFFASSDIKRAQAKIARMKLQNEKKLAKTAAGREALALTKKAWGAAAGGK